MDTEILDIVLKQVEEAARSKFKVREMLDQFKADPKTEVDNDSDPTPLDVFNIIESFKHNEYVSDKSGGGNDLLKKMLLWQYGFYELSKQPDMLLGNLYLGLYKRSNKMNKLIADGLSDLSEDLHIPYRLNMSVPLTEAVERANALTNSLRITVKSVYRIVKNNFMLNDKTKGIMPFIVFQHEVIGNEAKWNDEIDSWALCHHMYKEHYVNGLTKTEIVERWDKSNVNLVNRDKPNSISRLNKMLAKAERLIVSCENGTFPC